MVVRISVPANGMQPGSLDNLQMVVADADADAIRVELFEPGVDVSEIDDQPWGRFICLSDPDDNRWALQLLPEWSQGAGVIGVNPDA